MKPFYVFALALVFSFCACGGSDNSDPSPSPTPDPEPEVTAPTAKQWNKDVVGWCLGNSFECSPSGVESEDTGIGCPSGSLNAETAWGNPKVTQSLIKAVKDAGFNAIRIPVRWQWHITDASNMTIDASWLTRIKEVVGWCQSEGLKIIINSHHDKWLESQPTTAKKAENCEKLRLLWTNIATAFKDYDYTLAFAGSNEVHVKDNWGTPTAENLSVQNAYNQTFIDAVRATGGNNQKRNLIVQTYACNPDYGINGGFVLPSDITGNARNYISVEFHYYQPYDYAMGATKYYWGDKYKQYGDTPEDNETTMSNYFGKVVSAWSSQGLGVVIGEWGVTDHYKSAETDRIHENMTYYCNYLTTKAKSNGFSTFIWDNNAFGNGEEKFGIIDRSKNTIKATWITKGIFQ